jgi:Zn-finger nucleic acid-binding protein
MVEQDFGGVKVDVCVRGCKGLWFDWMELTKLDEANEGLGAALGEALKHPRANDEHRGKINCPKCGIPMYAHTHLRTKEVNVDECGHCGGFFLDSGELKATRDTYMSDQEEEEYLESLLNDMPDYQEKKEKVEKMRVRNEALRRYTRFLRLSYYVTGR